MILVLLFSALSISKPLCSYDNYEHYVYSYDRANDLLEKHGEGCQLKGISFEGKNLQDTFFFKADLSKSSFLGIEASFSNFSESNFTKANLLESYFNSSLFSRVNFTKSLLNKTSFNRGYFYKSLFREASVKEANFRGSFLYKVDLSFSNFKGSDLSYTNLKFSRMEGANFERVNFDSSLFTGAQIKNTNFRGADLRTAYLSEVFVDSQSDFKCAVYDFITSFRFDFPEKHKKNMIEVPPNISTQKKNQLIDKCLDLRKNL